MGAKISDDLLKELKEAINIVNKYKDQITVLIQEDLIENKKEETGPRFIVVEDSWYDEFIVKDKLRDYKVAIKDDKKSASDMAVILNYVHENMRN